MIRLRKGKKGTMKIIKKALLAEVRIEFKACLYFFAILFFYCVYRMIQGSFQADMLVMLEMILTTYAMGYIQVYLLRNFEESERLGGFEWLASLGCSLLYVGVSHLFAWFDRRLVAELLYFGYMMVCFVSVFWIYYIRRHWDTEELNQELEAFKREEGKQEVSNNENQ